MTRSHIIAAPANDLKHRLFVYEPIPGCALSPLQPYYALCLLPITAAIIGAIVTKPEYDPAAYQPWWKRPVVRLYLSYQLISKPAAAVVTLAAAIPVVSACPSWWASYQCFGLLWTSTPFLVNCFAMVGIVVATNDSTLEMSKICSAQKHYVEKMAEVIVAEDPLLEPVRCECLGRRGHILTDVEANVDKRLNIQKDVEANVDVENVEADVAGWTSLKLLKIALIKSADQWRRVEQPAERHNAQHFLAWRAKQCGFGEEADVEPLVPGGSPLPTSGPYQLAEDKAFAAVFILFIMGPAALGPMLPCIITHVLPGAIVFFPFTALYIFGICLVGHVTPLNSITLPVLVAAYGVLLCLWIQQTTTMATFLYEGEGWWGAVHATLSDRRAADYLANLWHTGNHAVTSQRDVVAQLIAQGS